MVVRTSILLAIAALLFSFGPNAQRDDIQYQVALDGRPIGTYTVSKTEIGNSQTFYVETETAAGLIGRINHKTVLKSSFQDDKLVSSEMKTWVNNDLESSSIIKWRNGKYTKQEGSYRTDICCNPVDLSSARLFFKEPVGRNAVFHESFGSELPLVAKGNNQYELTLPDGGIERYIYEDGRLLEIQFIKTFTTITVRAS